jgi:integrase
MYGSGLRLLEACRLRVKGIDFARGQIVVREGKVDKDRVVPLSKRLEAGLRAQIEHVAQVHHANLMAGHGCVWLPYALREKYPDIAGPLPFTRPPELYGVHRHAAEEAPDEEQGHQAWIPNRPVHCAHSRSRPGFHLWAPILHQDKKILRIRLPAGIGRA